MNKEKPSFISLFSGCGGFDIGFIENGFECLAAYDNDENVINVYKENIGPHILNHDLTDPKLPTQFNDLDVVISGSPCQGFSTVGLRKYEDPRNSLLLIGGEIAVNQKAKVFVAENVMGSLSGKHKKYWDKLIKYLEKNGYHTKITICRAQEIGLAQTRKRVILYAWIGEKEKENQIKYSQGKHRSLGDAINNINGAPNKEFVELKFGSEDYLISQRIQPGQKLCDVRGGNRAVHSWEIPEVFGDCNEEEKEVLLKILKYRRRIRKRSVGDADPLHFDSLANLLPDVDLANVLTRLIKKSYLIEKNEHEYDLKRSFNGKYRRLSLDSPSLTIDTNFGNPKYFLHPVENRGFSVREAARIQGFSDEYVFSGKLEQKFRMIGNAVPPPMAGEIARNVIRLL